MTFSEKYKVLESKFENQVDFDKSELRIESEYLPNFIPQGPVDYVLIAKEPSTGVPGSPTACHKAHPEIGRNFSWSVEDFIFHFSIRQYLCQGEKTYHLTDLAKGGMKTREAADTRKQRYERWCPLLREKLRLLRKPEGTRIIAIGNDVADFLRNKGLCERVEKVLHYTRTAAGHRDRKIEPWRERFPEFCQSFDKNAFEESITEALKDTDMESFRCCRPEGGKRCELTESRMKLMFYYKNRFLQLQNESSIVLKP